MAITMRAQVDLRPGALLRYDPPAGEGSSHDADAFAKRYRGRTASFVAYAEKSIGPLDTHGLRPGRYLRRGKVRVRFNGEDKKHELNTELFLIIDHKVKLAPYDESKEYRLGDLAHSILFYPDDTVRFKGKSPFSTNKPRRVQEVFVDGPLFIKEDGLPRYSVLETPEETNERVKNAISGGPFGPLLDPEHKNISGEDLELVRRGNVWAIYNKPSGLAFLSDKEELSFWTRRGVAERLSANLVASQFGGTVDKMAILGVPLSVAYRAFEAGAIDAIQKEDHPHPLRPEYICHKLLDVFAEHKQRVRALTKRVWREEAMAKSA